MKKKIREFIRSKKLKWTQPRRLVLDILARHRTPLRVADIHRKLRTQGVDLASVYRTLHLFLRAGILMSMDGGTEGKRYELSDAHRKHHHHLICQNCGKAEDFEFCRMGALEKEIKRKTRFAVRRHELNFFGFCPSCQNKREDLCR